MAYMHGEFQDPESQVADSLLSYCVQSLRMVYLHEKGRTADFYKNVKKRGCVALGDVFATDFYIRVQQKKVIFF